LPTAVPDQGSVPAPTGGPEKTVVIDLSHGNDIDRASMDPIVTALVAGGHDVRFSSGGGPTALSAGSGGASLNASLRSADAIIIANPTRSYTNAEIAGIEAFTDAGGRVLLLGEPPQRGGSAAISIPGLPTGGAGTIAAGQPNNVASQFGIAFGAGYLYDMQENANNYAYTYGSAMGENSLGTDVERTVFRDAVPLATSNESATVIASRNVSISATRKRGTYPVAVRSDNVVAVGDSWFLTPEGATLAANEQFIGNLGTFLVTGEKIPGVPEPATSGPSVGAPQPGLPTNPTAPAPAAPGNQTGEPSNRTDAPGNGSGPPADSTPTPA
jgi:hypothetical protein